MVVKRRERTWIQLMPFRRTAERNHKLEEGPSLENRLLQNIVGGEKVTLPVKTICPSIPAYYLESN